METKHERRRVVLSSHAEQRLRERFIVKANPLDAIRCALDEAEFCGNSKGQRTLVYRHPQAWLIVARTRHVDVVVTVLPSDWPLELENMQPKTTARSQQASGAHLERLAQALAAKGIRVQSKRRTFSPGASVASNAPISTERPRAWASGLLSPAASPTGG